MTWRSKALRLFLRKWVGARVMSKEIFDACWWDFRKYVSLLRRAWISIARAEHIPGRPMHDNEYVLTEMPDEDTIISVLDESGKESRHHLAETALSQFSSM